MRLIRPEAVTKIVRYSDVLKSNQAWLASFFTCVFVTFHGLGFYQLFAELDPDLEANLFEVPGKSSFLPISYQDRIYGW